MSTHQRIEVPENLLVQVRARDENAFKEFVDLVGPALLSFAAQKLQSAEAAQDIVQDVLYQVWQQGEKFLPTGTAMPYLLAAVRNRVLNMLKHERMAYTVHLALARDAVNDETQSLAPPADIVVEANEDFQRLRQVIATLTEHQQTALTLRYDQGLSMAEIAEVLGISLKGAERLMARIRQLLREEFLTGYPP